MEPIDTNTTTAEPKVNTIDLTLEEKPLNTLESLYAGIPDEQKEYFKKNPELLPNHMKFLSMSAKMKEAPELPMEEAYNQAADEFDRVAAGEPPPETVDAAPVVPAEKANLGLVRRVANMAGRSVVGIVSGGLDFGLEAVSGAARAIDWVAEKANVDILDDNDSWFYDVKEGLSEETKEQIKSLHGLMPKGDSWWEALGENLGSIAVGAYLLSSAVVTGAVSKGIAAAGLSGSASTVQAYVGSSRILKLALDGARLDVSATLFSDPGSIAALYGVGNSERAKAFSDWYYSFDPITRRGANLAEGLFMNFMVGSVRSYLSSTKVTSETMEQAAKDLDTVLDQGATDAAPKILSLDYKPSAKLNEEQFTEMLRGLHQRMTKDFDAVLAAKEAPENVIKELTTELPANPNIVFESFVPPSMGRELPDFPNRWTKEAIAEAKAAAKADVQVPVSLPKDYPPVKPIGVKKAAEEAAEDNLDELLADTVEVSFKKAKKQAAIEVATDDAAVKATVEMLEDIPEITVQKLKNEAVDKIVKSTPDLDATTVKTIDKTMDKIVDASGEARVVAPYKVTTDDPNLVMVGAHNNLSGIKFTSSVDRAIWNEIKTNVLSGTPVTNAPEIAAKIATNKSTQPLVEAQVQKLYDGLISVFDKFPKKVSTGKQKSSPSRVLNETIIGEVSPGIWEARKAVVMDTTHWDRHMKKYNLSEQQMISKFSRTRSGATLIPLEAVVEIAAKAGARGVSATKDFIKTAAWATYKSGFLGGAGVGSLTNFFGIDVTGDGETNLKDIVALGTLFSGVRLVTQLHAGRVALEEATKRDALVKTMKDAGKDIHQVLVAARALADKAAKNTTDPKAIEAATRVVKQIESYLFTTKEGLSEITKSPNLLKALTPLGMDEVALNNLRLSLQADDISRLSVGSPVKFSKFNFTSPQAIDTGFKEVYAQFLGTMESSSVVSHLSSKAHVLREHSDALIKEFGVPAGTVNGVWNQLSLPQRAAMVHTTRTLLGSIDSNIKRLVNKTGELTTSEVYEFMSHINQRRALGEYVRSGGVITDRLTNATGFVARGSLLSEAPETIARLSKEYTATKETLETLRGLMSESSGLSGEKITELLERVGANMGVGELAVQSMYAALFSHWTTAVKPVVENTIGLGMGVMSESLGAIKRGTFSDEIIGQYGLLKGVVDNIGAAFSAYKDRAMGKLYTSGKDSTIGKEFTSHRFAQKFSQVMQLEDTNFVNKVFHSVMNVLGFNPVDLVSAPDVFFKHLAFNGFENQLVVQRALAAIQEAPKLTLGEAVANIRSSTAMMAEIQAEALKNARFLTYTDDLTSGLTKSVVEAHNSHPVLRMVLPILKTPLVQARNALSYAPIFNMVATSEHRQIMKAVWDSVTNGTTLTAGQWRGLNTVMSRGATGLLVMTALSSVFDSSGWEVIGTGEYDPAFNAKRARGARQYGLWNSRTGDFLSLERFGFFKMGLGTYADIQHYLSNPKNQQNSGIEGVLPTLGYMAYSMILQAQPDQVDDIKSLMGASDSFPRLSSVADREVKNIFSRFIPSAFKVEGRASDPYKRAYVDPMTSAVSAIYSGLGSGESIRPTLDMYGNRIENPRSLVGYKGIPEGDEMYHQAESAGFDLAGALRRRSKVGGVSLGSSKEEQDIAYLAEKYHGEELSKIRGAFLNEVSKSDNPVIKSEMFRRLFQGINMNVKSRLVSDPVHGETLRRLLDKGGLPK